MLHDLIILADKVILGMIRITAVQFNKSFGEPLYMIGRSTPKEHASLSTTRETRKDRGRGSVSAIPQTPYCTKSSSVAFRLARATYWCSIPNVLDWRRDMIGRKTHTHTLTVKLLLC